MAGIEKVLCRIDDAESEFPAGWLAFHSPAETAEAGSLREVLPLIERAEAVALAGRWVVLALCYEAAAAMDEALQTRKPGGLPLASFAAFDGPDEWAPPAGSGYESGEWRPLLSKEWYEESFDRVHDAIASGDTYQVNLTFPMKAGFRGDDEAWFLDMCRAQGKGFFFRLEMGRKRILSVSPELFFMSRGGHLLARPMKGTSRRGRWSAEDRRQAGELRDSAKEKAENIMITDMMRNDLGRIAMPGSVTWRDLYAVAPYPTLWQMTSTVEARCGVDVGLADIMRALFPSASVTGAPKARTMELIAELEGRERGIYTGCIGLIQPGGDAVFNVAIRTIVVDAGTGTARLDVGGGLTWDSASDGEYDECVLKGRFSKLQRPPFALFETLRLAAGKYRLLRGHLQRMRDSASYFSVPFPLREIMRLLQGEAGREPGGERIVRLVLDEDGGLSIEQRPLPARDEAHYSIALAGEATADSRSPWLYHKTTMRAAQDRARATRPDADDVILINEKGELTESLIANIVLGIGGRRLTPPLGCGLLPGLFREELLREGVIEEAVLRPSDLERAEEIWLINSVRGWMPARLVE